MLTLKIQCVWVGCTTAEFHFQGVEEAWTEPLAREAWVWVENPCTRKYQEDGFRSIAYQSSFANKKLKLNLVVSGGGYGEN